ncbi:MAG: NAD(P)H-dependent oxidoreductase subunit E [Thermoguttaceae bacterium]|jgi:NADH-quinone oxidoreductase subunit E
MQNSNHILNEELRSAIEALFPRYPTKQAVVLPALHIVNERLGFVPAQAVVEIAELLGLSPAQVQDTLSFYGFFKQDKPMGTTHIWFCRSLSCAACGGEELLDYLSKKLGIKPGETTPDGRITLDFSECLGECDHASAIMINDVLHENMTKEKIDELLITLREQAPGLNF